MKRYAKVSKGTVTEVIVAEPSFFDTFVDSSPGKWIETAKDGSIRKNYAGIGYTYMSNVATLGVGSTDIFISQQPYDSWTISTTEAVWAPPSTPGAAPTLTDEQIAAGKFYVWNESNYQADPATAWVLTTPE